MHDRYMPVTVSGIMAAARPWRRCLPVADSSQGLHTGITIRQPHVIGGRTNRAGQPLLVLDPARQRTQPTAPHPPHCYWRLSTRWADLVPTITTCAYVLGTCGKNLVPTPIATSLYVAGPRRIGESPGRTGGWATGSGRGDPPQEVRTLPTVPATACSGVAAKAPLGVPP